MSEQSNIKTWPERIYLQHGDSPEAPPFHEVYPVPFDGVTWCQDRIEKADVEYVRADIAALEDMATLHTRLLRMPYPRDLALHLAGATDYDSLKAQGERQPTYCGYCAFPWAQCKCKPWLSVLFCELIELVVSVATNPHQRHVRFSLHQVRSVSHSALMLPQHLMLPRATTSTTVRRTE